MFGLVWAVVAVALRWGKVVAAAVGWGVVGVGAGSVPSVTTGSRVGRSTVEADAAMGVTRRIFSLTELWVLPVVSRRGMCTVTGS